MQGPAHARQRSRALMMPEPARLEFARAIVFVETRARLVLGRSERRGLQRSQQCIGQFFVARHQPQRGAQLALGQRRVAAIAVVIAEQKMAGPFARMIAHIRFQRRKRTANSASEAK